MARTTTKKDAPTVSTRREEIVAAAASVIAERGIKGATVRDIGEAAGILSGSLYYHFESKEQIVLELLMPSVNAQFERSQEIRGRGMPPTETLAALIESAVREISTHPNESVILRNEARTFRDTPALAPVAAVRAATLTLWVSVVKDGIKSGEFRKDVEPDVVVRAIFDGLFGSSRWFIGDATRKPAKVAAALVSFYLGGLRG